MILIGDIEQRRSGGLLLEVCCIVGEEGTSVVSVLKLERIDSSNGVVDKMEWIGAEAEIDGTEDDKFAMF